MRIEQAETLRDIVDGKVERIFTLPLAFPFMPGPGRPDSGDKHGPDAGNQEQDDRNREDGKSSGIEGQMRHGRRVDEHA